MRTNWPKVLDPDERHEEKRQNKRDSPNRQRSDQDSGATNARDHEQDRRRPFQTI